MSRFITGSPENTGREALSPLVLLNACSEWAWSKVAGIAPALRFLYHLKTQGITQIVVLVADSGRLSDMPGWTKKAGLRVAIINSSGCSFPDGLPDTRDILYIDAACIIDPRLVTSLSKARVTSVLRTEEKDENHFGGSPPAMMVKAVDLPRWRQTGLARPIPGAKHVFPESVDPYLPYIRGHVRPYIMAIKDKATAREATWLLIRSQQKKVMDLPSRYLDPFLENWLTRIVCNTPITPNMITFLNAGAAILVATLFWHGFFIAGAFLMFLVEILDGVDGKLARITLKFTKIGEYEDLIDYFYENICYVALAVGLGRAFPAAGHLPAFVAAILIIADTLDNVFYMQSARWFGKSIDLMRPFDAKFRLIAGRRNIYGLMFMIGFSLGYPLHTFAVAAIWGLVTAFIHGVRLFQSVASAKRSNMSNDTV